MEFFIGLISGILIILLLLILIVNILARARLKFIEQKVEEGVAAFKARVINSRIEDVNGQLFIYNNDTNEFLGQGKDFKELNEVLMKRFPDKLFHVPREELIKYEQVNK